MFYKISFILLALTFKEGEPCVCAPTHPQNAFCQSHFAIQALIKSKEYTAFVENYEQYVDMGIPIPKYAVRDVEILDIYNDVMQHFDDATNTSSIFMPEAESMCGGVELDVGTTYLLTGRVMGGKLHMSRCDWHTSWQHLSEQMYFGVYGGFDCRCPIASCTDGSCDRPAECKWTTTEDQRVDECTLLHRSCGRARDSNTCEWNSNAEYSQCVNELQNMP